MQRRFRLAAAALAGLLLSSCRTAAVSTSDPSEVVTAFLSAFNNLDVRQLESLFADDATAFLPSIASGPRLNGRVAIAQAIEPMFAAERVRLSSHGAPYLSLQARDVKVQRLSRTVAVVSFDVGTAQVFSRRTLVVEAVGGRWLIAHLHASNIRERSAG